MQKGKEGLLLQEKEKFVEKLSEIFFFKAGRETQHGIKKKKDRQEGESHKEKR